MLLVVRDSEEVQDTVEVAESVLDLIVVDFWSEGLCEKVKGCVSLGNVPDFWAVLVPVRESVEVIAPVEDAVGDNELVSVADDGAVAFVELCVTVAVEGSVSDADKVAVQECENVVLSSSVNDIVRETVSSAVQE